MSWSTHRNPRPDKEASAPYNFVPLPARIVPAISVDELTACAAIVDEKERADRLSAILDRALPRHDVYLPDRYTGYFDITLTTKSPLYIRGPLPEDRFLEQGSKTDKQTGFRDRVKNTPDFYYTCSPDEPVIPGSSLRGMLRSVLEIITYSKVQWVTDSLRPAYRAVAAPTGDSLGEAYSRVVGRYGRNVRAGYLARRGDEWFIVPAKRAQDVGLSGNASFFRVKEAKIAGCVPGLIPLNSPAYQPQYHEVSFAAVERQGPYGKAIHVHAFGPASAGYRLTGVLVCSGNMLETGASQPSPRSSHCVVFERDDRATPVRIDPQAVTDYMGSLSEFQQHAPFDSRSGCLVDGRPVFFVPSTSPSGIYHFGHCPNFRLIPWRSDLPTDSGGHGRCVTPLDLIPERLRNAADVDWAEALFGFVRTGADLRSIAKRYPNIPLKEWYQQGSRLCACAGRVNVLDAVLVHDGRPTFEDAFVPHILATPKPTAYQHYLEQSDPDSRRTLKHYDSVDAALRGTKRYWLQGQRQVGDLKAAPGSPGVDDEGNVAEHSTQHTLIRPVRADKAFTFRVTFENLTKRELGALCWTLEPRGREGQEYCHSLGMGKPLGMGAVQLKAEMHFTNRQARYSTLFSGSGWATGESVLASDGKPWPKKDECIADFEAYLLHGERLSPETHCTQLREMKRIAMLLAMMEWHPEDDAPRCSRPMLVEAFSERRVLPDPSVARKLTGSVRPRGPQGLDRPGPAPQPRQPEASERPHRPEVRQQPDNWRERRDTNAARPQGCAAQEEEKPAAPRPRGATVTLSGSLNAKRSATGFTDSGTGILVTDVALFGQSIEGVRCKVKDINWAVSPPRGRFNGTVR